MDCLWGADAAFSARHELAAAVDELKEIIAPVEKEEGVEQSTKRLSRVRDSP